jgi:hypothetical protein
MFYKPSVKSVYLKPEFIKYLEMLFAIELVVCKEGIS